MLLAGPVAKKNVSLDATKEVVARVGELYYDWPAGSPAQELVWRCR